LKAGSAVLENWVSEFDFMCDHVPGGVYNICCHPFVTGRGHRLTILEKLIQHIRAKEGAWFARAIDVANSFK